MLPSSQVIRATQTRSLTHTHKQHPLSHKHSCAHSPLSSCCLCSSAFIRTCLSAFVALPSEWCVHHLRVWKTRSLSLSLRGNSQWRLIFLSYRPGAAASAASAAVAVAVHYVRSNYSRHFALNATAARLLPVASRPSPVARSAQLQHHLQ